MEFAKKTLRVFFFVKDTVDRTIDNFFIINRVIQLSQFLVTLLAIIYRIFSYDKTYQIIEQIGKDAVRLLRLLQPSESFCIFITTISLFLIPIVIFDRWHSILLKKKQLFSWLISLIILILRVFSQSTMVQVYYILTVSAEPFEIGGNFRYAMALIMAMSEVVVTVISYDKRPLCILHSSIPLLSIAINNQITFASIAIAYTLVLLFLSPSKAAPSFFLLFMTWVMGQTIQQRAQLTQLIFCPVIMLLCLAHSFISSSISLPQDKIKQIDLYWPYIHRKQQAKFTAFQQFYIQSLAVQQNYQCDSSLRREQHLQLLSSLIEHNNLDAQTKEILKLKKKLEEQANYLQVLTEVHTRLSLIRLTQLYLHYEMYSMLLQLERWAYKFKSEITYINNVMELDKLSTKFHEEMHKSLIILTDIWQKVGQNRVHFEAIQLMYSSVIESTHQLRRIYRKMAQKKNASSELHKLKAFLQLVGGCNIQQNKSKEVSERVGLESPFLVLQDNRISFVSLKFAQEYRFNRQDLAHSSIHSIIPQEIQKKLMNFQSDKAAIKLKQQQHVMLNGQGYPILVNTRCYICPDMSECVKFIIFFENEVKATKRSCFIMFNPETEIIEDASQEFMLKYKVSVDKFNPNNQPIAAKEIFEGFQYDCDCQKKLQESTQGVSAVLNLKHLANRVGKVGKIKVSLRLLAITQLHEKKRLVLEVAKCQEDNHHRKSANIKKEVRSVAKVQGSYMEEIVEANDKIRRGEPKQSVRGMIIILTLIALVSTAFLFGLFMCSYGRINRLSYAMDQIANNHQRNSLFSSIMFDNLIMLNLNRNPPSALTPQQLKSLKSTTSARLSDTIDQFKQVYVDNINSPQFIPSKIDFNYINYQKSFSTTSIFLMDLMWEASLLIYGTATKQTIANIGFLSMIKNSSHSVYTMTDTQLLYFLLQDILMIGLTVVVMCSSVIFTFQRGQAERTLNEVELLYEHVTQSQVDSKLKTVKLMVGQTTKQKTTNRNLRKQTYLSVKTDDDETQPKKVKSKSHCSKLTTFLLKLLPGCILIMLFAAFHVASTKAEAVSTPSIVKFANGLRIEQEAIKNSIVQYYYKPLLHSYNGSEYKPSFNSTLVSFVVKLSPTLPLPNFVNNIWYHFNNNMCQADCPDIDAGVLELGYSKSINSYAKSLEQMAQLPIDTLILSKKFSDVKKAQEYLLSNMDQMMSEYRQEVNVYIWTLKLIHGAYLAIEIVLVAITFYLFLREYSRHCVRIEVCRVLFTNLPIQVFDNMEVQNIVKEGLLDRLNSL